MSGVLFPHTSPTTSRKHAVRSALAGRLLGKTTSTGGAGSGHKYWAKTSPSLPVQGRSTFGGFVVNNSEKRPPEQYEPYNEDWDGRTPSTPSWEAVGRGLRIPVVSSTREVHSQIPGMQDAVIGKCALAVVSTSHCNHTAEGNRAPPAPSHVDGGVLAIRAPPRTLRFANFLEEANNHLADPYGRSAMSRYEGGGGITNGILSNSKKSFWGYGYRHGSQIESRLGIYCKFPGAVVECPLNGPTFDLSECVGLADVDNAVAPDGVHGAQVLVFYLL